MPAPTGERLVDIGEEVRSRPQGVPEGAQPSSRIGRGRYVTRHIRWLGMVAFVGIVGSGWQLTSFLGVWPDATVPRPSDVASSVGPVLASPEFSQALRLTIAEIALILLGGVVIGFLLGSLFWRYPFAGIVSEPFLVAFYAVPVIVFYPVMVIVIGFGMKPIVVLGIVAATIPMTLNTWIGLKTIPDVYWKLARSLQCNRRQRAIRIAIPAAAPIIMAGVRLATIYAVIVSVSMEFLLGHNGLGYQIRFSYELFRQAEMAVYVLVVFVLAAVIANSVAALEARIVGRMQP